jgi:hypothetical protein
MREIKLRVWDGKYMITPNCRMAQAFPTAISLDGEISQYNPYNECYRDTNKMVIMQYTSFKDIKHKEIYESDILIDRLRRYHVIEYKDSDAKFICRPLYTNDWAYGADGYPFKTCSELEIIGNIYENPELLGESNGMSKV